MAYERESELQRFIQLVRVSMYSAESGLYSCPLAMTDGAAYVLMNWLRSPSTTDAATHQFVQEAYTRLTTRDPTRFWTSGQWMTEKGGGSDVSNATQTVAVHEGDNLYRLYGYKWFSSATDSDVSITLARVMKDGVPSAKLSMFLLRVRREDGSLNHIRIMNMKDKLGTR